LRFTGRVLGDYTVREHLADGDGTLDLVSGGGENAVGYHRAFDF